MKLLTSCIFYMCFFTLGQAQMLKSNVIIVINDKVVIDGLINVNFYDKNENTIGDNKALKYIPGELSIPEGTLSEISKADTFFISFSYYQNCVYKQYYQTYKIQFNKDWVYLPFLIIRLYDLNIKNNSKTFLSNGMDNYVYEIDSPNGTISRIKRRIPRNNCK